MSLISTNNDRRHPIYNPCLIFCVNIVAIIKSIISLLLPESNEKLFVYNGDFGHFIGMRLHFNIALILFNILALTSQLIHFYNYKNGIKPTYLKVFAMMSSLVSPKSVGLTDEEEINKLLKKSKQLIIACNLNTKFVIPLIIIAFNLIIFIMNCSIMDTVVFGIPHSLLFTLNSHYIYNINIWQVVYFHIICRYIVIKLKESHDEISKLMRKNALISRRVLKAIKSLNSKYSELEEYNVNYWSKYLLSVWLIFGTFITFLFYCLFFVEINFIPKLIVVYI